MLLSYIYSSLHELKNELKEKQELLRQEDKRAKEEHMQIVDMEAK